MSSFGKIIASVCLFLITLSLQAQDLIQSGPMQGYMEMREAMIWVQTKKATSVALEYWDVADGTNRYYTKEVQTDESNAFVAKLVADEVEPGHEYRYNLIINGQQAQLPKEYTFKTQKLWQWREDPPDFKIAMGSCTYVNEPAYDRPGTPYGGDYEIFEAIPQKKPDMMLWLGDNVYLREADWTSRSGIMKRYTHSRSLPEMRELLAATPNYAIWDDHDFGPNDSDRGYTHKDWTLEAFKLFWANPSYGINGMPGIISQFQFNDIDLFLLDNRYYRSPNDLISDSCTILGQAQIDWLIDALVSSKASFKMVAIGGQFLSDAHVYENYANCDWEKQRIIDRLLREQIPNIIFLSGDRHHTELNKMITASGPSYYELTVSPLTSGARAVNRETEVNNYLVEGTVVEERNFAIVDVSGPLDKRKLTIHIYDKKGKELWKREIEQYKEE